MHFLRRKVLGQDDRPLLLAQLTVLKIWSYQAQVREYWLVM